MIGFPIIDPSVHRSKWNWILVTVWHTWPPSASSIIISTGAWMLHDFFLVISWRRIISHRCDKWSCFAANQTRGGGGGWEVSLTVSCITFEEINRGPGEAKRQRGVPPRVVLMWANQSKNLGTGKITIRSLREREREPNFSFALCFWLI